MRTPCESKYPQNLFTHARGSKKPFSLQKMQTGVASCKYEGLLTPNLDHTTFYPERWCPAFSMASTSNSGDSEVAPSNHHSKCSKTSGAQAMRRPPSQQKPNSSSDFANNARKTLLVRYEVGMTNLLRSTKNHHHQTHKLLHPHGDSLTIPQRALKLERITTSTASRASRILLR